MGYPDDYQSEYQDAEGWHPASTEGFSSPLIPPDSSWDPAEELAFILQETIEQQPRIPAARDEDFFAQPRVKTPREALAEMSAELPPVKSPPRGHRRVRARQRPSKIRIASHFIAVVVTSVASAVSIFGGLIAYDPLRFVAMSRMQTDVVSWWPVLVFGPWMVASLSIVRAALHQRRALHSWSVLLVFSAIGMTLCVAQAPKDIIGAAAAALPSLASLACFQQVVRQITLTRPPRKATPRHRTKLAEAPAGKGDRQVRTPPRTRSAE
ncbi:hypothetical protein SAMN05428944_2825 [Streptomyces sp. 1222.5]|uniref:DUF2637 domain-containing protein n=1 Tax=unclassified Streptomyces TaxID=2593676 RepID=UPI00089B1E2A|nr:MULTISPECIES: DUF2637 domain-containing protein [unclassified Streptomyces]PKW10005.1 hypothetical protein BX260_5266 [Streptomyces sp. 5112.2]SEC18395.1 hypothetical protein SAMN05428944_2825 [Streptomyces sp. 1222.5]SED74793.1 hypothetical protein SAMN05216532_5566 [Streptomyces sp. 2231.1]